MRSASRHTPPAKVAAIAAVDEENPDRISMVELMRDTAATAMRAPLTLEEESVALHNLRLAAASSTPPPPY